MVYLLLHASQSIGNVTRRRKIRHIIHKEIHNSVHKLRISYLVFFAYIMHYQCIKHISYIIILCFLIFIKIGTRHSTL